MVEFAAADVSALPDPLSDIAALAGIPDWRARYILRYRRAQDRRLSLGVWRLMEKMLARREIRAEGVTFDAGGKPLCDGAFLSLSHSGSMAMCAVGGAPVGCDIERIDSADFDIAPKVFLPGELEYIGAAESEDGARRRFAALWTLKESYMKMTGQGLALAPERIEILLPELRLLRDGIEQNCRLFHAPRGEYEMALCAKEGRLEEITV